MMKTVVQTMNKANPLNTQNSTKLGNKENVAVNLQQQYCQKPQATQQYLMQQEKPSYVQCNFMQKLTRPQTAAYSQTATTSFDHSQSAANSTLFKTLQEQPRHARPQVTISLNHLEQNQVNKRPQTAATTPCAQTPFTQRNLSSNMKPPLETSSKTLQKMTYQPMKQLVTTTKARDGPISYFQQRSQSTTSSKSSRNQEQSQSSNKKLNLLTNQKSSSSGQKQRSLSIGQRGNSRNNQNEFSSLKTTPKNILRVQTSSIKFTSEKQGNFTQAMESQPIKKLKIIKKKKTPCPDDTANSMLKLLKKQPQKTNQPNSTLSHELKQKLNLFYKAKQTQSANTTTIVTPLTARVQTYQRTDTVNTSIDEPQYCQTARTTFQNEQPQAIFNTQAIQPTQLKMQVKAMVQDHAKQPFNYQPLSVHYQPPQARVASPDINQNNMLSHNQQQQQQLLQSELSLFNQLQDLSENHANNKSQTEEDSQDFINNLIKFNVDMQQFISKKDQMQNQLEAMRQMPQLYQQFMIQQQLNMDMQARYMMAAQNIKENQLQRDMNIRNMEQQIIQPLPQQVHVLAQNNNLIMCDDDATTDYQLSTSNHLMTSQGNYNSGPGLMASLTMKSGYADEEEEMEYSSDEGGNLLESQGSGYLRPMKTRDLL